MPLEKLFVRLGLNLTRRDTWFMIFQDSSPFETVFPALRDHSNLVWNSFPAAPTDYGFSISKTECSEV
jgi:hypothetical protein